VECAIDLEECVEVGGMAFAGSVWDVMGDHEEELERESGGAALPLNRGGEDS
jgi:hypothetical protein